MAEALSLAAKGGTRDTVQDVINACLRTSLRRRAVKVQAYLLDKGADVSNVYCGWLFNDEDLLAKPSLEAIEMLVAHGWDIDHRSSRIDWPLLWSVVRYHDLVEWCLDHGASVYLPGDTPPRDARGVGQVPRITLLEAAAKSGSVPTFKLLREKGAPFHVGVLHSAVEQAISSAPSYNGSADPSTSDVWFNERMDMVRYLVDEVGIDVNTEWWRPGQAGATPLDRVAYHGGDSKDRRELVWFLLDRGADLNHASVAKDDYFGDTSYLSPLEMAQTGTRKRFLEAIQQWQQRQRNVTTRWIYKM
ncbi:hypothetical protein TGAM01_v202964 [Trichoderma gamsii]|uniref:Ankyrin repeat protein n=1 Tax=Trichoderma gamsii TaxID=398673 RepID=A0A2P4ZW14_9HYPO|nr:hypothetical protein TGAM01_v202964 [Trichoderma gamsii]PON28470.1 hypothetical protein TGAM01_v202964 [Trichoderma gamsii]